VQRLAHELADRGHHVEVIHCTDAFRLLAPKGPMPEAVDDPKVTIHRLASAVGFLSPLATQQTGYPFFKAGRIRDIFARGFDVIHFHNISLVGGPRILEFGDAIKLYTMHEFWLLCPTHILFKFNREVCTERECIKCQLVYRRPPQLWRHTHMMENAVKHVDSFISPDRHTIGKHRAWWNEMPVVFLPHFVPTVDLVPRDDSAPPYFLFVGRLEKLKGLQALIPLFCDYPHAQLWIAGTGTYEAELRAQAAGSPNIRFLGFQSGAKFQALYRQAVAVVVPSINYEVAPPLVVLEAFRQQTPALVLNLGSMPEIIEDSGGAGFVYNDIDDLRGKMDRLCLDRALRDELGMRGYHVYKEQLSVDAHLSKYLSLIREIAAKRGRSID
jgi:glycosyltransferase involved in cell wall biosynthesis